MPSLPPGLNFDEAGSGVAALEILNGAPKIWWRLGGGQEPLWPYLAALSTAILGNVPLALRLPAALTGILTIAAVYPLLLVFRPGNRRDTHLIALLAALGLALSDWHLHFSRLGFRAILLPLLSTLAFYFFWRSLGSSQKSVARSQKSVIRYFLFPSLLNISLALSALFTALAIYSYLAARLLPFVPLLYWLIEKIRRRFASPEKFRPTMNPPLFPPLLIGYYLLLLLFLLPLVLYFSFNPADFIARSTSVSIFNPAWNQGDLPGTVWRTLITTIGTFFGLHGDPNPLVNLPGAPALPPLLVPFFGLGLLVSLYRVFSPAPTCPPLRGMSSRPSASSLPSPHLFLLGWWAVMLLPAILAPEGAPHHLRLIGTIVPTYAFVAIGLTTTASTLVNILRLRFHAPRFIPLLLTPYSLLPIFYLLLGLQTYPNYFVRWPGQVDFTLPFDLYAVRLAGDIAHAPPAVAYVLPMDIRAGEEARHYTLDYLLGRLLPYLPVDEQNAARLLTQAADGKEQVRVVRWTGDKHREADAKEILTYLLETSAHFQGRESFPVYEVETYALPGPHTVFALPAINQPIGANFDNLLRLDAAFVPASAVRGGWLPVALTLSPLAKMEVDYKVSLRLTGPTGKRVVQKDRILLHNFHQGTSLWPSEPVNEYYLLPVPADTPPGDYTVMVVIYHPETLAPLITAGLAELPLTQVSIK
ncbi:MAG: hypothetical protein HS126_27145 [Anaerolineales bacterium]|nr:hypothetical protein [Anaerolineales bacterium]